MKVSIGLGFSLLVATATASAIGCAGASGPEQEATRSESAALTFSPVPVPITVTPAPRDAGTTTQAPTTAPTCPPVLEPLPRPCSDPQAQTYVLRLPDPDGAPTYTDGFTVPFPTPWAAAAATEDKALQPIVDYEALLAKVPSAQKFEYLVKTVTVDGQRTIRSEGTRQFFVVGIANPADGPQALANAAQFPQPPVEAQILKCVHIVERVPNTTQYYFDTNIFFPLADLHDPSTHPNYQMSNGIGQQQQQTGGGSSAPVQVP
jgi:hypothetical protein